MNEKLSDSCLSLNLKNKILQGDSRIVLKDCVPDESVDLICTSPPYWDIVNYDTEHDGNLGKKQSLQDYLDGMKALLQQCWRVLKDGSLMFCVIRDVTKDGKCTLVHAEVARVAEEVGFTLEDVKLILLLSHAMYDYGLMLRKGKRNGFKMEDKYDEPIWDLRHCIQGSMKNCYKRSHPAEYVLKIPEIVVGKWSKVGDLVLDPFMGRGTTALACKNLNRNWIGVEISGKYVNQAKKRLTFTLDHF